VKAFRIGGYDPSGEVSTAQIQDGTPASPLEVPSG